MHKAVLPFRRDGVVSGASFSGGIFGAELKAPTCSGNLTQQSFPCSVIAIRNDSVHCWMAVRGGPEMLQLQQHKVFSLGIGLCSYRVSVGPWEKRMGILPFFSSVQFSSVAQLWLTLCESMDYSTPGLPVHHQLLEFTQTHLHWVGDAIQPSHPLLSPSPPTFNLSHHQGLFQ